MTKRLTERIAAQMQTQKPTRSGQNRAAFLAQRDDIKEALTDGWPVNAIWKTLHDEGKISFGYDAFISYVNSLIRSPGEPEKATARPPASSQPAPKKATPATPKPVPSASHKPGEIPSFNFNPSPNKADLI